MIIPDCNHCKYQSNENVHCLWHGRLYATCELEREYGNCSQIGNAFVPKDNHSKIGTWKVICENCTKIMMVLTSEIETDKYDYLTIGEFREQYPCLSEDCPAREIYGSEK